jgi:hypothetical protein
MPIEIKEFLPLIQVIHLLYFHKKDIMGGHEEELTHHQLLIKNVIQKKEAKKKMTKILTLKEE